MLDDPGRLPQAKEQVPFKARRGGFLAKMEAERIGRAAVALGAGRAQLEDIVDPAVGLVLHKKVGDAVEAGECLTTLHVNQSDRLAEAEALLADAFVIAPAAPSRPRPLVLETLS